MTKILSLNQDTVALSMIFIPVVLICLNFKSCLAQNWNNVCENFQDYPNLPYSQNCWYNPDIDATPEQITRNHGCEFQNYTLETEDGYFLTIFRIQDKFTTRKKQPILLYHGLMSTAMSFMVSGNKSLAFYLARNGYDVWLANTRGNNFSKGHSKLTMADPKYWDFSFHEFGVYDVPATLEFITEKIGNFSRVIFIGYSLGTTVGFVYSSVRNKHAEKFLKGSIAITPVTSREYSTRDAIESQLHFVFENLLQNNINVIFPQPEKISRDFVKPFCNQHVLVCLTLINLIVGPDEGYYDPVAAGVALGHHPARTSIKCLTHYLQFVPTKNFQQYDYGPEKNLRLYNSTVPPLYPLEAILIPVHMFYGLNDALASPEDVKSIYGQLKMAEKSMNLIPENEKFKYNHLHFAVAKDVVNTFYKPLMRILAKMR